MQHFKYEEIKILVKNNINVLLVGEAGSGKTTLIKKVIKDLGLNFYSITGTKQVTMNALLGFISINGGYIRSQLREAVEYGGAFFISEIDGMDPNTLLCLNTLENGYMSFPDAVVGVHKNFRLCADSNPAGEHQMYTGRSKLDAATLDRFDVVWIDRDPKLEILLTDKSTYQEVTIMRKVLSDNNMSKVLSMRDTIRLHKRKSIGLAKGYEATLLGETSLVTSYLKKLKAERPIPDASQADCESIDHLWEVINAERNA